MADVKCPRCEEVKDSTFDFYWSQDKRQRWCKECFKHYTKTWHRERSEKARENKLANFQQIHSATTKREKA